VGDAADFAPFYVGRAELLKQLFGRDQERDLRRAVQLAGADRTVRIHLIRYLQDRGRWEDAVAESDAGRAFFPGDFNLDLLHVQSLIQLGRPHEAIEILNATHVLPSENARASHRLYEQAHALAALDAMEGGESDEARRHLRASLEWPEHLGQGRPYAPEERLVQYLLGTVEHRLGERDRAREAFEAVVAATGETDASAARLDLLAIPSLVALGQTDALRTVWTNTTSDVGRLATELIRATQAGVDMRAVMQRLAAEHPRLFDGLQGRMLLRALSAN
jgi:tetratricopeptide (TPR) repeat protein